MGDKIYPMRERSMVSTINSRSRPGMKHTVTVAACTCEDFTFRHFEGESPFCVHIIARYLRCFGCDQETIDRLAPVIAAGLKDLAASGEASAVAEAVAKALAGDKAAV